MTTSDTTNRPSSGELRWFGLLLLLAFLLLGGVLGWQLESLRTTASLWSTGLVLAALYYAVPPLRLPLYLAWTGLTRPIGQGVSHLVLAAIYFGVVSPIGLGMRLVRRDVLERRFDAAATSYWNEHDPGKKMARYFRQS